MQDYDEVLIHFDDLLKLFIDYQMQSLSGSECKLWLSVFWQTVCNERQETQISLKQFVKDTGLSRNSVVNALQSLSEKRLIHRNSKVEPHSYELGYYMLMHPNWELSNDKILVIPEVLGENIALKAPSWIENTDL